MYNDDEIDKAKAKMQEIAIECIQLLEQQRPIEAATCYLGLMEEVLHKYGIPPAQIQYAAMAPRHEKPGHYSKINVVPSVDLSAIVNDVPMPQQNAAVEFAALSFERVDKCIQVWAIMSDEDGGLSLDERHEIGDAFRLALGAVSLVRQYGYHFNPLTRGPKPCELPDLDALLIETDETGTALAMTVNPALRSLMKFVMDKEAYEEFDPDNDDLA